jgi:hypothetical protein
MKKRTIKYLLLAFLLPFMSCESYLNQSIQSLLSEETVFNDYVHAQGYLEQCYKFVVNYAAVGNQNNADNFLQGDEYLTVSTGMTSMQFDQGTINNYTNGIYSRPGYTLNQIGTGFLNGGPGIWQGWIAIRICNIVLRNVDNMTGTTQTEKNLLKGQALFFRAYFHHEIMKFWGAIPYVDKVLDGKNQDFAFPRPTTYKESALKADADFAAAAELLPNTWDDLKTDPTATFLTFRTDTWGNNLMRINKVIVYSYKGKNLLLAASPLMKGSRDTYDYDQELCAQAAEAFAHVILFDRLDVNDLGLTTLVNYPHLFYTTTTNKTLWPGTAKNTAPLEAEYIFSSVANSINGATSTPRNYMPYGNTNNYETPNHRYVHKIFGTANGLSCDEDPTFLKVDGPYGKIGVNEFDKRDPRFYANMMIDGDLAIVNPSADANYKYLQLYNTGLIKAGINVTGYNKPAFQKIWHTGYFVKKWADITFNVAATAGGSVVDNVTQINASWTSMRLTDVYLMYAEALAATTTYGSNKAPTYSFLENAPTALEVINTIRDRFSVPHVETAYNSIGIDMKDDANRNKFMDVVRRERACELCFEGERWTDLRRWQIADQLEYKLKTSINFDRTVYPTPVKAPTANLTRDKFKNINFTEKLILTRVCDYPKQFWLPFPTDQTQMYDGFPQNPGW